ncbi:methyltransferase domain-containing protein [Cohnella sp. REN36]|uniref:methyltransferase domain-containing protein n=1 Tax=Cohnella sp. REN36 TaxID=2887347 RepID=UPI001D151F62|nr:methyltransferase domain-containing protein [Cohnella sp. REN36]MCC3375394.1 methyltransferase domain-containing protein [Cohnella sp. REN36]
MTRYFATVLPGLEDVLTAEIRTRLPEAALLGAERGKVIFAADLPFDSFPLLRTADNLYRLLLRFAVGPHKSDLVRLERDVSELEPADLLPGWAKGKIAYQIHASRVGPHTYSRFEAADAAARGIERRCGRRLRRDPDSHALEFRLDIAHDRAAFSLRLTDAAYRFRGAQRTFTRAALRPTVAHALVWLSGPAPGDRFVDPCCGSGTLLGERLAYPYAALAGGDLSEEAVAAAKANVGTHPGVRIRHWDARRLPLDAASADKIAANLPFGRQIAADEPLAALYRGMLGEMRRVLAPGGRAIVLTDAREALLAAAADAQLRAFEKAALSLKGLQPSVYALTRD